METVEVELSDADLDQLGRVADTGLYGSDLGAALRDITVSWTIRQPRVPA